MARKLPPVHCRVCKKDIDRQNKIIETLGCRFIRYNEEIDLLYEVK